MSKKIPECIGFIMDGNRRWAKERGLSSHEGHTAGFEKVKEILSWSREVGVAHVILYGLSTENWKRAPTEIAHLLVLFEKFIEELNEYIKTPEGKDVRVRFLGDLSRFPKQLERGMYRLEKDTASAQKYTVAFALSYGGRLEILKATQKLVEEGGEVTEERFSNTLWSKGIPDPDLIVRTGGDQRLSNFLPWQSVYSELIFIPTYWPAFGRDEFEDILQEYERRTRNFGV